MKVNKLEVQDAAIGIPGAPQGLNGSAPFAPSKENEKKKKKAKDKKSDKKK